MLEATLSKASLLKRLLDSVKDLVTDANFDCTDAGIALQAMDNAHVALCCLLLRAQGFEHYRCDRNMSIGLNVINLTKMIKCAGSDDSVTLKADEKGDVLGLTFESPNSDRTCEFELKLMDIDSEHLGIPDIAYDAVVTLPSAEFQRICRDISVMSESVMIEVNKEGVRFSATGDAGKGSVFLKPTGSIDDEEAGKSVSIELNEPVSMALSLKYLLNFCKATSISDSVMLSLKDEIPMLVEYKADDAGYVRYYLAPKMGDAEEEG